MAMDLAVRIADIDERRVSDIVLPCKRCAYWERPEQFPGRDTDGQAPLKREWFEATRASFGPCGKVLYADGEPAAYAQYAPPRYLPGVSAYPGLLPHVDRESILISCLYVPDAFQGKGLGRVLLAEVIEDARSRGFRAVQTYARNDSTNNCSGPTGFYLSAGFAVVATEDYPNGGSFSLVRLELGGQRERS